MWATPKKERQGPKFVAWKPSIASHQRVKKPSGQLLHKREGIIALVFFVLLAIGSSGFWAFQQVRNNTDALTQQATVAVHPTATATIEQVYNRVVAKEGVQFGFDAQHDRFNPYERQISASNVSHLRLAWTSSANNGILSSPAIANGVIYIGSEDNNLYAFQASGCGHSTCVPLWTSPANDSIFSSPAIATGNVYVGSRDQELYVFHLSTFE